MLRNIPQNYQGAAAVAENPQPAQILRKQTQSGPMNVTRQKSVPKKGGGFRFDFGPSSRDILNFTNQIAVMIRAGISIQDSLESIASHIENKKFAAIIADLKNKIEAGKSFSQALADYPQVFNNLYINMVAAAEASGSLSTMLQKLAEYLDQEADTRSQIKGTMVYPIIIAIMAISVTVFLLTFVLPRFMAIFAGKENLLPTPTKVLMASSAFLRGYWIFILLGLAGLCIGFWYFTNTPTGRLWWDKTKLTLPLIKTLCRSLYITRSLHTMGVLTGAGVPISL